MIHRGKVFAKDAHIKEILILPSSIDLHSSPLLLEGKIIIQDKASCFPAFVLNPEPESHVIDACAAPGNKTSHLSAIMKNTGKIYAFDMDQRRLGTLIKLTSRAGCKSMKFPCVNVKWVNVKWLTSTGRHHTSLSKLLTNRSARPQIQKSQVYSP